MTHTRLQSFSTILAAVLLSGICFGQATGVPPASGPQPFGTFGGGPFDSVNLGNLNVGFNVPIAHRAGRGLPFSYDLSFANSVWYPVTVSGNKVWTPVANWGWQSNGAASVGYLTYYTFISPCYDNLGHHTGDHYSYFNWNYHDKFGRSSAFTGSIEIYGGSCSGTNVLSFTSTATDGTGYTLNASGTSGTISDSKGVVTNPPVGAPVGATPSTQTDRNGNQISESSSGVFTDTLGTTALTITGSNPVSFAYTSPSGASAAYLMHYTTKTVKTAFGCSGISEYGPTSANLISDITLPDGSQYLFTYEATPGFAGDVTGRIKSVTLPTGGAITYTYTGGNNGIICADGSTAGLTRQLTPGGTWTYTRSNVSGPHWTTTITDPTTPTGNQTVIDLEEDTATANPSTNFYETQRLVYQGSSASGTLLRTNISCYNNSAPTPSACAAAAVATPINRRIAYTYLPDASGLQAKTDTQYLSGFEDFPVQADSYDYGSASVGPLLRSVVQSFGTFGKTTLPNSVSIKDGAGTVKASTTYAYDQVAVTATSGTPNWIATVGPRGNLTQSATTALGATTLYQRFTYYDTGTTKTATGAGITTSGGPDITTYTYGSGVSCGNSFVTSVSEPLSLSQSMTWNCTGGVLISKTDENGKVVSSTYSDPNFWRPALWTDQLSNATSITYPNQTTFETSLTFNTISTVDARMKRDAFGRTIVNQRLQQAGGSTYDSVEYDYDILGKIAKITRPYAGAADAPCTGTCPGTSIAYDAIGRPTLATDAGGGTTTISYPQNRNDVLRVIGPAPVGETTKSRQLEYDALGRLTSVCEVTGATGSGACGQTVPQIGYLTKYTYNTLGSLTGVTQNAQPGGTAQTRSYVYDMIGRLISETNPESVTVTYTYDSLSGDASCGTVTSVGDLVKKVDTIGNVTCVAYDSLHRATSVTYPTGAYAASTPTKKYVYDSATVNGTAMLNAKTQLAEAYTCTGACSTKITDLGFSYSARGEVTDVWELTPNSGGYYHVTNVNWANGALKALSGIPGVPTITYGADGEGRPNTVSAASGQNPVTSTTYNVAQQVTALTFGSLDNDAFTLDPNTGRMTQYKFNVGAVPQSLTGNLTWNGNATLQALGITDQLNSANTQSCAFGYDDMTRITGANCGATWAQTFSLDPFGNLSKSGSASFLPTYAASTNRFSSIPGGSVTYDGNGNLTNDVGHTYTWDTDGNVLGVDGSTVTMIYDAFDRMIEQTRGSSHTQILYSPLGTKLALMNAMTLVKAYVSLPSGAKAVYTSAGLAYYRHADHLGSSRLATTPTRTKFYDVAYAPYGEDYSGSGTPDLSFTGQNTDTVGGGWSVRLDDFMFREYRPSQGRWISPDRIGQGAVNPSNPQSWNRYAYVLNNPLVLVDPLGLCGEVYTIGYSDDGGAPINVYGPPCGGPPPGFTGGPQPPQGGQSGGGGGGGGGTTKPKPKAKPTQTVNCAWAKLAENSLKTWAVGWAVFGLANAVVGDEPGAAAAGTVAGVLGVGSGAVWVAEVATGCIPIT